jgi:hypothetical protein
MFPLFMERNFAGIWRTSPPANAIAIPRFFRSILFASAIGRVPIIKIATVFGPSVALDGRGEHLAARAVEQ